MVSASRSLSPPVPQKGRSVRPIGMPSASSVCRGKQGPAARFARSRSLVSRPAPKPRSCNGRDHCWDDHRIVAPLAQVTCVMTARSKKLHGAPVRSASRASGSARFSERVPSGVRYPSHGQQCFLPVAGGTPDLFLHPTGFSQPTNMSLSSIFTAHPGQHLLINLLHWILTYTNPVACRFLHPS